MDEELLGDDTGSSLSDAGESTIDLDAATELSDDGSQETVVGDTSTQEKATQDRPTEADQEPKDLKSVREWGKGLEKDIKQRFAPAYAGLEKTATELYGAATPEDVQAALQTVQTLAPALKVLIDPAAKQADVISTLTSLLPAEHMETLTWAALNDPQNQEFIFSDPEVLKTISDKLFEGRTIEEMQSLLKANPVTASDPEREAWRKEQSEFKAEQQRVKTQKENETADTRRNELMTRFFETPAQRVIAEDFKLVAPEGASEADKQLFSDTAKDIRFAAQGRFLEANMDEYQRIQNLYASGRQVQAQAAEIRLAHRYEATLIKTTERHANLLKSRSTAKTGEQQDKINSVRPDVSGSVAGNGIQKKEDWGNPDDPSFAQRFAASFHN